MSKELTPLEALEEIKAFVQEGKSLELETDEKGFDIIENALKSPIIQDTHYVHIKYEMFSDMQKKLKALEIIKEKNVDTRLLKNLCFDRKDLTNEQLLNVYNNNIKGCGMPKKLTQEEFDLLKTYLN